MILRDDTEFLWCEAGKDFGWQKECSSDDEYAGEHQHRPVYEGCFYFFMIGAVHTRQYEKRHGEQDSDNRAPMAIAAAFCTGSVAEMPAQFSAMITPNATTYNRIRTPNI